MKIVGKIITNAVLGGITLIALNFVGGFFGFHLSLNVFTAIIIGLFSVPGVGLLLAIQLLLA